MSVLKNNCKVREKPLWPFTSWLAMLLLLLCANTSTPGQQAVSKEYQVKALFLYNFTQFVEWPANAFAAAGAPLVIGILGKDPFGAYVDDLVRGDTIGTHPLEVKRFANVGEIGHCHILFINLRDRSDVRDAIARLKSKPVLTVSDAENFATMGGVIQLYTDRARIRTRINTAAITQQELVVSSKLLRLSEIVSAENN